MEPALAERHFTLTSLFRREEEKKKKGKGNATQEEEQQQKDSVEIDDLTKQILNFLRSRKDVTLMDAVSSVSSSMNIKPEDATRRIYLLREADALTILDAHPPSKLQSYLFSAYSIWFWALVAAVTGTVAAVYLGTVAPLTYPRYVLGFIFVLYLPGFALIELLYPKRAEISQFERIVLSVVLSIALVPLVGLVLNYTPLGIGLDSIIMSLSLLTVCLAAGAVVRKFGYLKLSTTRKF